MALPSSQVVTQFVKLYLQQRDISWLPAKKLPAGPRTRKSKASSTSNNRSNQQQQPQVVLDDSKQREIEQLSSSLNAISLELQQFISQSHQQTFNQTTLIDLNKCGYEHLRTLADELFSQGISWSNVITFLVHGAALCHRAIELSDNHQTTATASSSNDSIPTSSSPTNETRHSNKKSDNSPDHSSQPTRQDAFDMVHQIIAWISTYIDENLLQWIQEQDNGWFSVQTLSSQANDRKSQSNSWNLTSHVGVAAFAIFVGGLYLSSKFISQ